MYAAGLTFFITIAFSVNAFAQSCPAQGTEIFPDLQGQQLLDALVQEYKSASDSYDYDEARDVLYGTIDVNNDSLTGIYTGYTIYLDPNADPSSDAYNKGINAEHGWPQSKGASSEPARSDMHHLYPTYTSANSSRGNHPYADINDEETVSWWRNDSQVSTPDYNFIDEYSERREGHPSGLNHPNGEEYDSWEPREDAKGDIARSMFYFYTMYKDQADAADPLFFEVQKEFLRSWNTLDSVSQKEYDRTCAIAGYQSGKVNPFVIDPTLVERAYFEGAISQTTVEFSASVFSVNEGAGTIEIEVTITNPNPDTTTTVDVVYTGGTATAGDDFIDNITTNTVTFPAGSLDQQSVMLTLIDDDISEQDETILLELQNISGPENAIIGQAGSLEITIQDNDGSAPTAAWINEFHYDNDGGDTGEFVELAVNAQSADLSEVTLTLYNGSNGTSYGTYSGTDFVQGESVNGISFYYVDLPVNGLQNGSPDGMSLDMSGELIQFISYEGTFTAVDGPAQDVESTDVGAEEPGTAPVGSSLQLAGTGGNYGDFTWEFLETNTKGDVNTNQDIELIVEPEMAVVQFSTDAISVYEDTGTVMIEVSILNPDADQGTTVEVALAGGTAEDADFEFDSPETLTFPAGSSVPLTVPVTINDNSVYDAQRSLTFALQNVTNGEIGATDTLKVVIRNDDDPILTDYWINEFHYQNSGSDSSEFVEVAENIGIFTKSNSSTSENMTITLYNGSNGEAYDSFTAEDITMIEETPFNYNLYYVEVSGLQNGNPDGISLSINGNNIQFISYGGTFVAQDGPAQGFESIDIGIVEPENATSNSSLSLTGEGIMYRDFSWAVSDSASMGAENKNQDLQIPVSNEEEPELASEYKLHQNYPNPFNPTTVISYQLPVNSEVRLEVFDMLGRNVATLINNEQKSAGSHQVTFEAGNLSSGVYIYRLSTNNGQQFTRKMLLMK